MPRLARRAAQPLLPPSRVSVPKSPAQRHAGPRHKGLRGSSESPKAPTTCLIWLRRYDRGMAEFVAYRDRDAWFVIRGFRYQIDLTILRWIELREGQTLELEAGEDIDTVARSVEARPEDSKRLLEQVKHLDRNITLRSPEALAAVANVLEHLQANPGMAITFRMVTNASPGVERPSPYDDRCCAIEVWEAVRNGLVDASALPRRLAGIRSLLSHALKPEGFNSGTWDGLQALLSTSSDEELRVFISGFEWSIRGPGSERAAQEVRQALLKCSICSDQVQAEELYRRLFLEVVTVLCQPGRKQLSRTQLLNQATLPPLSEHDRARLNLLATRVIDLEVRVSDLEQQARDSEKAISSIGTAVNRFLPNLAAADFYPVSATIDTCRPSRGANTCERRETVAGLQDELSAATWLSIHGGVGCGKSYLCVLLGEYRGVPVFWIPLRDTGPEEAGFCILTALAQRIETPGLDFSQPIVAQLVDNLATGTMIILDDLPRIQAGGTLCILLHRLVGACRPRGVSLLSSSHHAIPATLGDMLAPGSFRDVPCPRFSDHEASELFAIYGASSEFAASSDAGLLNGLAQGHPTLLVAIAQYLASAGWRVDRSILAALQRHEHEGELIGETVNRLLRTVQDQSTRELLYRLCLILGRFGFAEVQTAATVVPPLERPRERMSALLGLWVEQEAGTSLTVNPLAKPLSETELAPQLQASIQEALADRIVQERSLSVLDVVKALHYLKNARAFGKAGSMLILALSWRDHVPRDQLAFLLSMSWLGEPLPAEMDLGLRIYLRAHQIAAQHYLELGFGWLLADATGLLDAADDAAAWAVFGFAVITLPAIARLDFKRSVDCLLRGLRAFPKARIRDKQKLALPEGMRLGHLVWFNIIGIRSAEDFRLWVQSLGELDSGTRGDAFAGRKAEHGCQLVVDRLWMAEHDRPEDQRSWPAVLSAYEEAIGQATAMKLGLLWVLLVRAKVVVLAEYMDDIDAALSAGTAALGRTSLSLSEEFLLCDIIGRQFIYKKRPAEGIRWLRRALATETESFVWIRCRTFLETSRAIGDTDRDEAAELAEKAVLLAREYPDDIGEHEMVVALGELAMARWLQGDMAKAFHAFDEAAEHLLRATQDTVDWKQLFVILGSIGGYLATLASTGSPPEKTADEEPYATPFRGMLLGLHPRAAELYGEQRVNLFYALMSMFAEVVGDDDRSASWALRGIDSARRAGMLEAVSTLGHQILPLLLETNRFAEAIDVAIEFCVAMRALMERRSRGLPSLQSGLKAPEILGPKPNAAWNSAERDVAVQALSAVMARLGQIAITDAVSATEHARQVCATCGQIANSASDPGLWNGAARVFEAVGKRAPYRELHKSAGELSAAGYEPLHALAYLAESLLPDTPIEVTLASQSVAISHFARLMGYRSSTYRRNILGFLASYWRDAVEREAFRFTPPCAVQEALSRAVKAPEERRAQEILKCVLSRLGRSLPKNLDEVRKWLNGV